MPGPRAVAGPVLGTHLLRSVLAAAPGPLWSHIPWVTEPRWNLAPSLDDELGQRPRRFWWAGVRLSKSWAGRQHLGSPSPPGRTPVGRSWLSETLLWGSGGNMPSRYGKKPCGCTPRGRGGGWAGRASWLQSWCGLSSGTCPPQAQGIPHLQSPNPEKEQG